MNRKTQRRARANVRRLLKSMQPVVTVVSPPKDTKNKSHLLTINENDIIASACAEVNRLVDENRDNVCATNSVNNQHTVEVVEEFQWDVFDEVNEEKVYEENDETIDKDSEFKSDLAQWTLENNITLSAASRLLKILRDYGVQNVPADARTLCATPRSGELAFKYLSGGKYVYFGLQKCLKERLSLECVHEIGKVVVDINIDGLPIFSSRNISVWPIQIAVSNVEHLRDKPFVVAMFCGNLKPQNQDFLKDTIDELQELQNDGFEGVPFQIRFVICDAPARAMVKGTVQFNGRYGCDFCDVRGVWDRRMMFLEKGNLRTDYSFRNELNPQHHKSQSIFLTLTLDMIKQFPLDPMHCLDLGVTKRLLLMWKDGPREFKLTYGQLQRVSDMMVQIRNCFPSAFNRKPRRLDELKMWKATEYRTFLLYAGPILLKDVLDKDLYVLFLSLSIATAILYSRELLKKHHAYAEKLLEYFVAGAIRRYDRKFCSYNVHCLLHLSTLAQQSGSLLDCSAYKFENNMTDIKRSVRGTGDPIVQIANRVTEQARYSRDKTEETAVRAKAKMFKVRKNMCYKLEDGRFARAIEVNEENVLCDIFLHTEPVFMQPCDSRIIGIHKGYQSKVLRLSAKKRDIASEAILIPNRIIDHESNSVSLLTLNHTL